MKRMSSMAICAAVVLIGAQPARAHVTVWPQQSHVGAAERYAVRVPTERSTPTTSIELEIPRRNRHRRPRAGGLHVRAAA